MHKPGGGGSLGLLPWAFHQGGFPPPACVLPLPPTVLLPVVVPEVVDPASENPPVAAAAAIAAPALDEVILKLYGALVVDVVAHTGLLYRALRMEKG